MGIRIAVDRPVDIIRYPNLPKGKNYIFAAGHSLPLDWTLWKYVRKDEIQ